MYARLVLPKATKADLVYEQLRGDILARRHLPGERLRYVDLCERYATSTGVLREALLRLVGQGLVIGEPQHGFRVVPLSASDLLELTQARRELASVTLRLAIATGDLDWESRVIAAHHRLANTEQLDAADPARLSDAWVVAHDEYHAALLDGCPNLRLKAFSMTLRESADLYRQWSYPLSQDSHRDIAGEHAAILQATVARDAPRAIELLTDHIQRTTDILLASAEARWTDAPEPAA